MPDPEEAPEEKGVRRSDPLPAHSAGAPMSEAQRATLQSLCDDAGIAFDGGSLTTTEAARRITELQKAKDRQTEAARLARGAAPASLTSAAGEEDPGAALNEPKTKAAIQQQQGNGPIRS